MPERVWRFKSSLPQPAPLIQGGFSDFGARGQRLQFSIVSFQLPIVIAQLSNKSRLTPTARFPVLVSLLLLAATAFYHGADGRSAPSPAQHRLEAAATPPCFVYVPGGWFWAGSDDPDADDDSCAWAFATTTPPSAAAVAVAPARLIASRRLTW